MRYRAAEAGAPNGHLMGASNGLMWQSDAFQPHKAGTDLPTPTYMNIPNVMT